MNCEIVRDLLPLYVDETCSPQSREAVERHLDGCPQCRDRLAALRGDLPDLDEAAPLGEAAVEWNRQRRRSWWKGVCAAAAVCLLAVAAWYGLFRWCCIPMTQEDYALHTYQLSDGSVGVHVDFLPGKETLYHLTWKNRDGVRYFYMARPVIRSNPYEVDYSNGMDSRYPPETGTAYFGLEDGVLLMEDGVAADHPTATEAEEQKWSP